MNGVPDTVEIRVTQNAKGIWSCDRFSVQREKFLDAAAELDAGMTGIETILDKHNLGELKSTDKL